MPSSACFADSPHLHSFPTRRSSDLTPNILRYMPRFSILDLAAVRTGGTIAEAYRNTVDLAQHADGWGFTRFWLAEHHNMPGIASAATSVLIVHVAGKTSTIRVGSGGVMLPNH